MATLKLDTATHDLYLNNRGNPVLVDGIDETAQRLKIKYQFFLGEWFLDQRQGIPFLRDVFVKNPNIRAITAMFRQIALEDPGVESIESFRLDFDVADRTLIVTAQLKHTDGDIFSIDFNDLILG